jgi:hypothetical protein
MLRSRARAALLGLLTLLLTSSLAATTASAAAGPFAYHRAIGEKGNGVKISEKSPEQFKGEGGQQKAASKISGIEVEGVAKSVQIKGIIYNNSLQGQLKMELGFREVSLTKPNLPGCEVKFGKNDTGTVVGHLAWKWNSTKKQLEEPAPLQQGPSGVGLGSELAEGATELPSSEFTTISFSGSACGVLIGKYTAKGSETIKTTPSNLGEWSKTLSITLAEGKEAIHFWNGKAFVGADTSLTLGSEPAKVEGESKAEVPSQEIAVFEN